MVSLTFSFNSSKPKANIEARLTFKDEDGKRVSCYGRIPIEVDKDFWSAYSSGKTFRDIDKVNLKSKIDSETAQIRVHVLHQFHTQNHTLSQIDGSWLKQSIHEYYYPIPTQQETLTGYWQYYTELKKHEDSTVKQIKLASLYTRLHAIDIKSGKTHRIDEVNESYLSVFIAWHKAKGYAHGTILRDFKWIRTVCRHAAGNGFQLHPQFASLHVKAGKEKNPTIYLDLREIDLVRNLSNLPDYLDNVRDWLLVACSTGQRVSDFMRMTPSMIRMDDKGRRFIDLTQEKTGANVTIPLLPEVANLLEKRKGNFPRAISDQKFNEYAKEVCKRARIDNTIKVNKRIDNQYSQGEFPKYELISSHVGRKSFSSNYYGIIPTSLLKNITGHSTEQMLLKYIGKTSNDTAADAYDLMVATMK
ncbi:MAG: tyrosine-type recombinase/integrase [Saprospiraceae bacterium]|uniref:Tyrosine-type recombinase/integrase n=1 Tax=Candidatus Opimibacter skivensis TaxID=2982028 RepID=A0A9D7SWI5_9BACT|nr:tyrosine-type recombinase/integrase [Candidatus Opimibacter skivensis]